MFQSRSFVLYMQSCLCRQTGWVFSLQTDRGSSLPLLLHNWAAFMVNPAHGLPLASRAASSATHSLGSPINRLCKVSIRGRTSPLPWGSWSALFEIIKKPSSSRREFQEGQGLEAHFCRRHAYGNIMALWAGVGRECPVGIPLVEPARKRAGGANPAPSA